MTRYTKTGDAGETQRADGQRVRKSDPMIIAEGELDELNAHLGLCVCEARRLRNSKATARAGFDPLADSLETIQRQLFALGAMLGGVHAGGDSILDESAVEQMERDIDRANASLPRLGGFILPAGEELAARLHAARTICRRAERAIVRLTDGGWVMPPLVLAYVNRLGDWLFVLARVANEKLGRPEREL